MSPRSRVAVLLLAVFGLFAVDPRPQPASAQAPLLGAPARLPVKEVTIFKDGHAFVLHEGVMPVDAEGNVVLDNLPNPVIGTFWPYSADADVKLVSVTAGRRRVRVEQTATSLAELLRANVGAEVIVSETPAGSGPPRIFHATITAIPERSIDELTSTRPAYTDVVGAEPGGVILLKTTEGTRVLGWDRIHDVSFKGEYKKTIAHEEFRNVLTLRLDWGNKKPAKTARVGMAYLQKGLRWIPNYRVEIDGGGKAFVKLQATLLNELTDLDDVTAHLVVGVPTFTFKDTVDPIALGQATAQLSQYFEQNSRTAYALSNAMTTQMSRMSEHRAPRGAPAAQPGADVGPDIAVGGKSEDLFLFTRHKVSLKKGQRSVMPVADFTMPYTDAYVVELAHAPPPEIARTAGNNPEHAEWARMYYAPKAIHRLRLTNKSTAPLTTAPAMIVKDNRIVGQAMMTYTSPGAATDITLTTAVDVRVAKSESETKRTPNVAFADGYSYLRTDLAGRISLTSFSNKPIEVEVVRHVFGHVNSADNDGKIEMVNLLEDARSGLAEHPHWHYWYSWPGWWRHVNGVGRITWTVKLEPGKTAELKYAWHYFWR